MITLGIIVYALVFVFYVGYFIERKRPWVGLVFALLWPIGVTLAWGMIVAEAVEKRTRQ